MTDEHWPTWLTTRVDHCPGGARRALHSLASSERSFALVIGRHTAERFPWLQPVIGAAQCVVRVPSMFGQAELDAAYQMIDPSRPDVLVGIGGGSVMDMSKLLRFACIERSFDVGLRVFPTLAGSGSEVTPWASLWDDGQKSSREDRAMLPDIAVVDPSVTGTAGVARQIVSGLDAMAHAIESTWGVARSASSAALATEALRILVAEVPRLGRLGSQSAQSTESKFALAKAGTLAGVALCHTKSAGAHAVSYHLTGRYGVDHGVAVGFLSAALLHDIEAKEPEIATEVVRVLGVESPAEYSDLIATCLTTSGLGEQLRSEALLAVGFRDALAAAARSARITNHPVVLDDTTLDFIHRECRSLLAHGGVPA